VKYKKSMSNEKKSYYAIIPAKVRYDKSLTMGARMLYGELTALSNEMGFCYASNNYFSELYEVTPQAISKWIKALAERGYIKLEYLYNGKEIKERHIYIQESLGVSTVNNTTDDKVSTNVDEGINKRLKGYQQKVKENNTDIIIQDNNTNSRGKTTKKKTKADYELFLNSLDAKDNETYRKSAVLFADFKKSITPKFTASNATLLKWQYDFALYSQKHSINPEELYNALSYAIYDNFWKTCLFSPKNLFNSYEKIRQKMYFSKNQSSKSHRKFDVTVMPDFVNDYIGVANVERK
jgi:hypothetical protein